MSSAETFGFMTDHLQPRANASTGLTQFQILEIGKPYKAKLIKMGSDQYSVHEQRWEVMHNDPIALFLWQRYMDEVTAKPDKFYALNEEGQPEEIMADIGERWDLLNMNIMLKDIGKYIIFDGFCLNERFITPSGGIDYNCYGFFHTQPNYWDRVNMPMPEMFADHNKIARYKIWYIPRPLGVIYDNTYNMHAVERFITPGQMNLPLEGYDFDHFTRGSFNEGLGNPRAQGIWDSMTMLRKYSWSDYRRSLGLPQLQFPSDMDEGLVEDMMNAVAHWDENDALGIPLRINPTSQETEPYPAFFERTPDQTGAVPKGDPTTGGTLLRSAEWSRFLAYTGYSETKIVGSQPGAVEGSKLDLTRDDRVDIREFQNLVPIKKELLKWLLDVGKLEGCDPESLMYIEEMNYDIKCHIEWEVLENMEAEAEMMEEEAENQAEIGAERSNAAIIFNRNMDITDFLMACIRDNAAMPMTPVMSSWIKGIGFKDDKLYMETHEYQYTKGASGGRHFTGGGKYEYSGEDAEAIYQNWVLSDSKGGFWWDSIRDQLGPSNKVGRIPLPKMFGAQDYNKRARADQKYKVEGDPSETRLEAPGLSREGFKIKPSKTKPTPTSGQGVDKPKKVFPTIKKKGKGRPASRGAPTKAAVKRKTGTAARPARGRATANAFFNTNSFKDFNGMIKDKYGAGMSETTFTNMRRFFTEEFNFRYNSMSLVKVMDFNTDLWYPDGNGGKFRERACKNAFKAIETHEGPLKLYEDRAHGGEHIVVGTYKYSWEDGAPMAVFDYDKELILNNVSSNSPIAMRINAGLEPEMSTEYFTGKSVMHDGILRQVGIKDEYGRPRFRGIAIVDEGNCNSGQCPSVGVSEA